MKRITDLLPCGGEKTPYSTPCIEVLAFRLEEGFMVGTNLSPDGNKPIGDMENVDDSDNWG